MFALTQILPARLALPGAPHDDAGSRGTACVVLAIVLAGIVVDLVIDVFMLAAPNFRRRRTGYRSGCGALGPTTGGHGALYRMLRVGLGLAGTGVLLDGLGGLTFEGNHGRRQGAGARQQHQDRQGMGQNFHHRVSRQTSARLTVCQRENAAWRHVETPCRSACDAIQCRWTAGTFTLAMGFA
ncbi:hypothetical protein D3C78_1296570 [compost metagenome]